MRVTVRQKADKRNPTLIQQSCKVHMQPSSVPTERAARTKDRYRTPGAASGGGGPAARGPTPGPPGAHQSEASGAFLQLFSEKMVTSKADWDQNKMAIVKEAVASSKNDVIHAAGQLAQHNYRFTSRVFVEAVVTYAIEHISDRTFDHFILKLKRGLVDPECCSEFVQDVLAVFEKLLKDRTYRETLQKQGRDFPLNPLFLGRSAGKAKAHGKALYYYEWGYEREKSRVIDPLLSTQVPLGYIDDARGLLEHRERAGLPIRAVWYERVGLFRLANEKHIERYRRAKQKY